MTARRATTRLLGTLAPLLLVACEDPPPPPPPPPTPAEVRANLRSPDVDTRRDALFRLGAEGADSRDALPVMLKLLAHDRPEVRVDAVEAIVKVAPDAIEVQAALIAALVDKDPRVQLAAADAFGDAENAPSAAVLPLVNLLSSADANLSARAGRALSVMGPEGQAALQKTRAEAGEPARTAAAKAIFRHLRAGLIRELYNGDEDTQIPAIRALAAEGEPGIPTLQTVLRHQGLDTSVYAVTVETLASLGPVAREPLESALRQRGRYPGSLNGLRAQIRDDLIRKHAAAALGELGDPASLPALTKALSDDAPVCGAAIRALASIGHATPEVVSSLAWVLTEKREDANRQNAATALGRLGPEASAALPALVETLSDPDVGLRASVIEAVGRMAPASAIARDELWSRRHLQRGVCRSRLLVALARIDTAGAPSLERSGAADPNAIPGPAWNALSARLDAALDERDEGVELMEEDDAFAAALDMVRADDDADQARAATAVVAVLESLD